MNPRKFMINFLKLKLCSLCMIEISLSSSWCSREELRSWLVQKTVSLAELFENRLTLNRRKNNINGKLRRKVTKMKSQFSLILG